MTESADRLKIVFAGTPEFAARALEQVLTTRHQVCAVYTQPDRPSGRGLKLVPSPVKVLAQQHDIPVFQPATLRDPAAQAELAALQPDLMVVVAYGLLLPPAVLEIPVYGCVNVHASLLPRWRGAAPIQRAILAGDRETGVTIMQMDQGLDTGAMLLKKVCPIGCNDTSGELHDRLAQMGGEALLEVLEQVVSGTLSAQSQQDDLATYAAKLDKEEARIDWFRPASQLERLVNGFNPWPVAFTVLNGERLRIWRAHALPQTEQATPGTIIGQSREGVDVACGEGVLRLVQLQMPGRKPVNAAEFGNAHVLVQTQLGGDEQTK